MSDRKDLDRRVLQVAAEIEALELCIKTLRELMVKHGTPYRGASIYEKWIGSMGRQLELTRLTHDETVYYIETKAT